MIKIEENVPLAPMTTFKVGGPARYFVKVSSASDIKKATDFAKDKNIPIFILGGGSNLIISSKGFDGLVIKLSDKNIEVEKSSTSSDNKIIASAAVPLSMVVNTATKEGLGGLGWAGGVPGTFGGAIRGNAGAFGGEMKDVVENVTSIDPATGNTKVRDNSECKFAYRESIFKHNNEIILEGTLKLKKGDVKKISQIVNEHIRYRHDKHPVDFPCAGSVFKNVDASSVENDVREFFKSSIKTDPFPVIPTARIIAEAGLAGKKVGGAEVSKKHTNYIINTDNATGEDIVKLISEIRQAVWNKYKITLEIEPQLIGLKLKPIKK